MVTALRQLPLVARHASLGARLTQFAGWQMPLWYSGALAEHLAVRNAAGVFDVSHMGRTLVLGSRAGEVLAAALSRDPGRLDVGESQYALACNEHGGIIDDLIVYRLGTDRFLVIHNAANVDSVRSAFQRQTSGPEASLEDAMEGSVLLAVQGPRARERLAALLTRGLLDVDRRHCVGLTADGSSYFVSRTGYTGEDGFEVMTDVTAGGRLLDRLVEAGCLPCGLAARDSLRLEAALALHGQDIDETTTPWAAGLGWAVEMDHEFVGRDALAAKKDEAHIRLACLVADNDGVFRHGYEVFEGDRRVGKLTSGGHSPVLGRSIGIAYLPKTLAREGASLSVEARGRRIGCHVVRRPFYKAPPPGAES